ncbi:radical SAM protein [Pseudoduganella sp. R-31]|uniref:radical SAM protein n=1 Tax=Pseudoduganella sp. R-31 TaxID=3404060 RepID=UPI003CF94666
MMDVQVEVSTRCNFDCFYCAGRDMAQGDMPLERFRAIVDRHVARYGVPRRLSLQGEGEPTLNRDFFAMAAYARTIGAEPFTITNGTYKYPEHFLADFRQIGVSIDTLDACEAASIGRHNLERVIEFVENLRGKLDITIFSVAVSASVQPVREWCRKRGLRHMIQPLQGKDDYSRRYPQRIQLHRQPTEYRCHLLENDGMRYYDLSGGEMPCCFIKDASRFESIAALRSILEERKVPLPCAGCAHLR